MGLGANKSYGSEKGVVQLIADLEALLAHNDGGDLVCFVGSSKLAIKCHTFLLKLRFALFHFLLRILS